MPAQGFDSRHIGIQEGKGRLPNDPKKSSSTNIIVVGRVSVIVAGLASFFDAGTKLRDSFDGDTRFSQL